MHTAKAYSVTIATSPLTRTTIQRRDPTERILSNRRTNAA
jgi:hypothetical protein